MENMRIIAKAKAEIMQAANEKNVPEGSILYPVRKYLANEYRKALTKLLFTDESLAEIPLFDEGTLSRIVKIYGLSTVVKEFSRCFDIPEWVTAELNNGTIMLVFSEKA